MKYTKAELEAKLKVAQSLVQSHQAALQSQQAQLDKANETLRLERATANQTVIDLGKRIQELERRLLKRSGRLEGLEEFALKLAHGFREYR